METTKEPVRWPPPGLRIRMLGPLAVTADDTVIELPASRKARALFAYLALSGVTTGRSRLCELLWEFPSDPRGELRWCLSKIRKVLGSASPQVVETSGDGVRFHLDDRAVDARAVAATRLDPLNVDQLRATLALFAGDFLEGLEIDRSPQFSSWLIAQRRRFKTLHAALLEQLADRLPTESEEAAACLGLWVQLAPTDSRPHAKLLSALGRCGNIAEGERHLSVAERLFESEGLDFGPVRAAWKLARNELGRPPRFSRAVLAPLAQGQPADAEPLARSNQRASVAVMPFGEAAVAGLSGGLADGVTDDVITRLAMLRGVFVIARGSVFALAERQIRPTEAGRKLNVDYVVNGSIRRQGGRILIAIELSDVLTERILWTEVFDQREDAAFELFDKIVNSIVASISSEIDMAERNRAMLRHPESLNAWEAYHRGLWHMYRFTRAENDAAQNLFRTAVRLDPTFAPAHAGLSFTHWQAAFQHWGDRDEESGRALETAGVSLLVDAHSPAAHWAMGRALWLRGQQDDSLVELERAVALSPSFALGHYTLAFVHSQTGDPAYAIRSSELSRNLSPFDPLMFAMLSTNALSLVRLGRFEEAVDWALKGAARPNAHNIILATAAHCLALVGRLADARTFVHSIRKSAPHYCAQDYLTSFRFNPDDEMLFRESAKRIGLGW